jgi:hypothetical protein
MLRSDFQRHFQLLLSIHGGPGDRELNYPEWLALKRGIYKLLAEAGSESRCAHPEPLYDGIICITCGRKPNERNTLA